MRNLAGIEAPTNRFRFDRHDRVTINGVVYRWANVHENGHLFRRHDAETVIEAFTHEQIYRLHQQSAINVDKDYFRASKATLRLQVAENRLSDLPEKEQTAVLRREDYCKRFLTMECQERGVSRSDASMQIAIARILADRTAEHAARLGRQPRCDSKTDADIPPSPSRLRYWLRRYEATGYDPLSLRDGRNRSDNRNPQYDMDSLDFMTTVVRRYPDSRKPNKALLYSEYRTELTAANSNRTQNGQTPLKVIGKRTFEKAIDKLPPFLVSAGRDGEEAALRKSRPVHGGQGIVRPLERIEMDEWKVTLQTILVHANVWSTLTKEEKQAVERSRLWLSAAIDVASRCVLSLRLLNAAPSASSAIACLEMAVSDKTLHARAAGTETPWDMYGRPGEIATDYGAAYVATETQVVIKDIRSTVKHPAAGMPELRGHIERLFGTIEQGLMGHFAGRTFENILRKGDYDSEGNATLDIEELNRMLIRFVVDVYHNTPHSGLYGETPRDAWLRLTRDHPVELPPNPTEMRGIFGLACRRRIQNRGVRFLGVHYQSLELQKLRQTVGQKPVLVRVNRFDLSAVSVKAGDTWITATPAVPGLDLSGISVWEWAAAAADLRRKHANMAKMSTPVVYRALAAIRDTAEMAIQRAELGSPVLSDKDLNRLERDLFRTFAFQEMGEPSNDDILDDDSMTDDEFGPVDEPSSTDITDTPNPPARVSAAKPVVVDEFGDESDWLI